MYDKIKMDKNIMSYILTEFESKKNSYELENTTFPDISVLCMNLRSYIEKHIC